MAISTGPAIRAVCRILNQNSCGSGTLCGIQPDGRALVLTNAHVAGTQIGRVVSVEVESTGDKLKAKVVAAAYSDRTASDWALLETLEPYQKVEPVKLSKNPPSGSHYTKGFPRCQPFAGTDITTVRIENGVWFWEPDAIGGQSGSGVFSDTVVRSEGILTWQWGQHGAGQPTCEIYGQMRSKTVSGNVKPPALIEVEGDYDFTGLDRPEGDPVVESGYCDEVGPFEVGIQDYPIWWTPEVEPEPPTDPDDPDDPNEPTPPTNNDWLENAIESQRKRSEFETTELERLESKLKLPTKPVNPEKIPPGGGPLFGLAILMAVMLAPLSAMATGPTYGLGPVKTVQRTQQVSFGFELAEQSPVCTTGTCNLQSAATPRRIVQRQRTVTRTRSAPQQSDCVACSQTSYRMAPVTYYRMATQLGVCDQDYSQASNCNQTYSQTRTVRTRQRSGFLSRFLSQFRDRQSSRVGGCR